MNEQEKEKVIQKINEAFKLGYRACEKGVKLDNMELKDKDTKIQD